jgi:hypothetical protein
VTVAVECIVAFVGGWIVLRAGAMRLAPGPIVKIVLAALGMAAVMALCVGLPWYANVGVGIVAYAALVLGLKVIDRAVVKEILTRPAV